MNTDKELHKFLDIMLGTLVGILIGLLIVLAVSKFTVWSMNHNDKPHHKFGKFVGLPDRQSQPLTNQ
jgi:hypothetical protein